ncbi:hypothetical protein JR316_0003966 [Psilocybe cubensis]|uniref:Uncharacterized protein n=2 Tax=Psilocybe cubensis TaxID=181762 RepID=A0A8H7Y676_PSICU|nr:hypothetical protein JR316_0003966 [Psilocybe cubensis]KAH9484484.1 hypothetical protein JR316_0003966 [Psilocybe cubensis]
MATSFAAYASQYLNRQQGGASTVMSASTSQPMFFSFTTDNDEEDGGRRGKTNDSDLDDFDDPHLGLGQSSGGLEEPVPKEQDDEDPYLRLDEDEELPQGMGRSRGFRQHQQHQQSIPLIARSPSPASPPGWLAHLAQSPPQRQTSSPSNESNSSSSPPPDLFVAASPRGGKNTHIPPPPPQTQYNTIEPQSLSLTESLLPRDGSARPFHVFSLPDPRHTPRKRRKHHDAPFISLFLALLLVSFVLLIILLAFTSRPSGIPASLLPYTVMVRTVPVLVILTCISAVAAYAHVWALRWFVGPVMAATEVAVPAMLGISAIWAFVGSFMWDEGQGEPTWGETTGLRLFSIIPLVLCLITARRLLYLPKRIHTTSSTLSLSTYILMTNPFLLALSPALLIGMLIVSIPFITMVFRLLLIGYTTTNKDAGRVEWHVKAWANWAIAGVLVVWLWSWTVARGVLRTTCASVVGAWYFSDPALPPPPPTSTHTIHAALTRSTGPSLGSIILAALILTAIRILTILTFLLHRLPPLLLRIPWVPLAVPVAMYLVPGVRAAAAWLEEKTDRVSKYALVYVGLTGVSFWEGARRGGSLVGSGRERDVAEPEQPQGRRQGRRQGRAEQTQAQTPVAKKRFGAEPPLALLTISPLTLTFPFALLTYLFVAHTLNAPNEALGAALLAGGTTAIVGLFCVGVVRDTADTLYMCYCIDKAEGVRRREEVFVAFEYGNQSQPPNQAQHPFTAGRNAATNTGPLLPTHNNPNQRGKAPGAVPQHRVGSTQVQGQPETIIPRSPLSTRRSDGTESMFGVGHGIGRAPGMGGREDTESELGSEEEQEEVPARSKPKSEQKRSVPISPYRVGSDSEDDDDHGRTPTTTNVPVNALRPPHPLTMPHAPSRGSNLQPPVEEEEEDLDPFKTTGANVDEEVLLEGLGGGGYPSTSPRNNTGAGYPTTSSSPPGRGVHAPGLGLAHGFNLHEHKRSTSGGLGGLDFGVGAAPTTPTATGGLSGFATAGGALAAAHRERMMSSTQELNMKSQFLMNMRGSGAGAGSGYGADSAVSATTGGSRSGAESEGEGEESQLGPGSDFFK